MAQFTGCDQDFKTIKTIINNNGKTQAAGIPILKDVQAAYGYLPMPAMEYIADNTEIDGSVLYGSATFYSHFKLNPTGKYIIKTCHGTACHVKGAGRVTDIITDELGIQDGETTKDKLFTLEVVACLGCCSLAPVMMINDKIYGRLTPDSLRKIIKDYQSGGMEE